MSTTPSSERPIAAAEQSKIRDELQRVLASASFRKSTVLARLLSFLVEQDLAGNGQCLKETYIGHVLYQRDATYDPRIDALVRVNANRLRHRLEDYYSQNPDSVVRLEISRGSYTPVYRWDAPSDPSLDTTPLSNPRPATSEHLEDPPHFGVALPSPPPEPPRTSFRNDVFRYLVAFVLLVIGIAAFSLAVGSRRPPPGWPSIAAWNARPLSRLGGAAEFPQFSPDGKQIAFVWTHGSSQPSVSAIYIQNLDASGQTRITYDDGENTRPAWSPDGTQIAFIHRTEKGKELRIIQLKDRQERKVADLLGASPWLCEIPRVSWARDGGQLITSASSTPDGPCGIVSIDLHTGQFHPITQPADGQVGDLEPALSPTQDRIAFIRNAGTLAADIFTTDLHGKGISRITHDERDIIGFCWDSEGNGFVLASRRGDGVGRLWHASLAGSFVRMSEGTSFPAFPSINFDGTRIVFSVYHNLTSIWRVSSASQNRLIADSGSDGDAQTSPDGKTIAFGSDRTGAFELWLANSDGSNVRRLTFFNGPMTNGPAWSPDSKTIAFQCRDQGNTDICTMPASGGSVRHLTNWTSDQVFPSWSDDGRSVIFSSNRSGRWEIYQSSPEMRQPERITQNGAMRAAPLPGDTGLLVTRESPASGIYCGPGVASTDKLAHCQPGSLLLPLQPDRLQGLWAAAPGAIWFVRSTADGTTELARLNLATRQVSRITTFPGSLALGDRPLSVEPAGHSALITRQDLSESQLDLMQRVQPN